MYNHASMNRAFRLIWNAALDAWVPAPETARGRRKGGRRAAAAMALSAALGLHAQGANAAPPAGVAPPASTQLPTDGHVVAGAATIDSHTSSSSAVLNVNQSTNRAVIDWGTFDVGSAAEVNFNQPGRNSATLNRVLDSNPSQIHGHINATGQVFLTNANGVYFGKSATVDVGGLVATTHDVDNADFMQGNVTLKRNGATGSVVNEGQIHAALEGYVALLAPEVRNSGVIVARMGTVAMAAGDSITLNFDGHHLAGITTQPSTIAALVENQSAVVAPGGLIILSARAVDSLQGGVVRNTGTLEATGMSMKNGRIVLEASSSIENSGVINADAGADGSPAGSIAIDAPQITNSGTISAAAVAATNAAVPTVRAGGHVSLDAGVVEQTGSGVIDVSGVAGGSVDVHAVADVSMQGVVRAASLADIAPEVSIDADSAIVRIAADGNVTLQNLLVDVSGERDGGRIVVTGGHRPSPTDPTGAMPTLALIGATELRASGRRGRGGNVDLTADRVGLFDASAVDASGALGGGVVRVGGDYQGSNPDFRNAQAVYIDSNATIAADALNSGDGGRVIVWSDANTRDLGHISARGGAAGGNGGFVEVSSHGQLDFRGTVNTLAAQGRAGNLLLDPYNLTISSGSDTSINGSTPFDPTGTGSVLNVSTLQNALAASDVTVTTGVDGGEAGTITIADTVGWFSNHALTLSAASTITVSNGVSLIAAGDGNISLTSSGGGLVNSGTIRTYGGDLSVSTSAVSGNGSYNIAGTSTFNVSGDITLTNAANRFGGAVSLLSAAGQVQFNNSQATVLRGATAGVGGLSITSGGSVTTSGTPTGIDTASGPLTIVTTSGTNGSILYTGAVNAGGSISLTADGNGAIAIADINGAASFASVIAGGAITLGDSNTGALTFDSASGAVLSGTAGAGGQASGTATITGSSITLNDPFVTKGGNLILTATTGSVTAGAGANITTTANTDTGTASGTVTVNAANDITLQNIVTTGANNALGVGSNAAAVTLTSATGDVNVGAITTSGGDAKTGSTSNRNGGNAGNIVISAPSGTIYLNGDLTAVGGDHVGTATQGLGGYVDIEDAVVLTADRVVTTGATSGDVEFKSTIDSDSTARSLSITAGIGSVKFFDTVGSNSALSSLSVVSSTTTTMQGDVTTNAAGGVEINATTIRLGDDSVANGSGAITIDTLAGNGTVYLNSISTYLDDAVTFTRGTGAISFTNDLYSKSAERNALTFNGANGGAISVAHDTGGTAASTFSTTALGDILVSSGTDLSFGRYIAAGSLVSLNTTGRLSLGCSSCMSFFDRAAGFQVATDGSANNIAGDENIVVNSYVTLSDASAPLSISAPNGTISFSYPYIELTTAGGDLTLDAGGSLTLPSNGRLTSNGGLISLSGVGVIQAADDTVNAGSGKIRVDGGGGAVSLNGVLQSTDADTSGTSAVLISNAGNVSLRSVTAQTGTLQVGSPGNAITGSLTQYLPGNYTNAIDIHTLTVASDAAITLTSTSNTIDRLGDFTVGSSLDVEARGRSAGMELTGDVTATIVTIKTGNGALALGDYDIKSTTGNIWLQGTGLTQSANSTITSAGTTQIYGNDYQNGTRGNVTMAGSIVSANNVYLYSTLNLQLPDITIGSTGSRGNLYLGDNSNNSSPWATFNGIYGTISQSSGTAIKIGAVQGFQMNGYGTIDLANANNEIRYLGYFNRGGTFSVFDADTESNGLTSTSSISDGTNNTAIRIGTGGAYNLNGQQLYGQGLTISASSISGNGNLWGHSGSGGSIVLIANGGDVTLIGDTYTNGTGADLVIRTANNVQLGSRTHIGNSSLTLGADATAGTLAASQSVAGAGNLSIDGTAASGGSVSFGAGQRVAIASAGDDSGITYTITGTDMFGHALTETITGANAGTASGSKYFNTVTQIAASGAAASTVSVGTAVETIAGNVTQTGYIESAPTVQGRVGGSITLTNGDNTFQRIGNLTSGGDMSLYTRSNPLTVTGAALSTGGNVSISSGYAMTVSNTGSVGASGSGKSVTLTSANGYGTSIQGALSADTGGITINSGSTFANTGTGTITTTGGVSIKTYWDGLNARNLTLGGNITAGANGIKLNSSGTINQTGGVLTTTGALSGPDSSGGGSPGVSNPSARGSVTLNGNNEVGSLGPWYVYNTSGSAFSFKDVTGGLTLSGGIETSNGNVTISTAGGALNLATYGVYAGSLASGGANVSLTGQGITQASGTISATGSADGSTPRNGSSGGTITLTGYDGTASGAINLGGTIQTANNTASAVTIRGTAALALPNISAPNGSLNIGDTSQAYYHITGAITQTALTALDIKTLNITGDSSAVLANTGNKIVQLGNIAVGDNGGVDYDLDVYNSTNGLSLTHDVTSDGGVRIITAQGGGSSGALALGNNSVYGTGDIYLGALGITQGASSTIDANHGGAAGEGGDITVDGGGGTNNITLGGTVQTDGAGSTLSVINATNATLNVISAVDGTVVLGTQAAALTGSVSQVASTGVISANTLTGDAGIVNVSKSNIDNLGDFTTTGALTLKDQGGAGTAGLTLTGDVTVGAASHIETSDGELDLATHAIDASGGTGYDLVLKGVGVSQGTGSSIKSTTANVDGGAGDIDLFSDLNDFTGQVTLNSTGSQVAIQDVNQLSLNALSGKLASTTSVTAWAGTNLVLTPETITTTSGDIDFRSLDGDLSTPGNLTTGSGNVTLIAGGTGANGHVQVNNTITTGSGSVTVQAATEANLSKSIVSTSGNISVSGDTVIHSTGSPGNPLTLRTGGAGTITVDASGTGGFVMGQYYSYESDTGAISITSGGTADLANITSSGDVTVNAAGAVQQLAGSSITANALSVAATDDGAITLANANNDAAYIHLRSLDAAGTAAGAGNIGYNDKDAVAVRRIQTTGNATLTAGGAITTDTVTGPGTVTANALSVKTLNNSAADISLIATANDVNSVTLKVRNAADTADVGVPGSTGNIDYTDANGFTITSVTSGGNAELTAGGAVAQTGAILVSGLGLSGNGSFTLNNTSSGVPINQVSTFASNATGAVNFSSNAALTVGTVSAAGPITGVTTGGASITLSAPSIDASAGPIDTTSSTAGTAGGAVTLTATGTGSAGNLTVGSIDSSGSNAAVSTNGNGGAAGAISLTSSGDTIGIEGIITARGGAGDGSGSTGADGLVTLAAASGAVTQANGSGANAIDAGKLLVSAARASSFLDTGNSTDFVAAKITGAGEGFTYRSGGDYTVGAGNGSITGLSTQGGDIDLGSSNVAITDVETITTKGGNFSADGIASFDSTGVTLSTAGDVTFSSGTYKSGGDVSITTTSGDITTGPIVTSGDSNASAAAGGGVALAANGVLTTGTITSTGAGTSAGGAVDLSGATVRLGGQINTGGGTGGSTQAAGGNISVTGPAVVRGADLVLNTGTGDGDVTFASTIDSDNAGSLRSLTITAGSGDIDLQGALGNTIDLKNVVLDSSGTTTLGGSVTANSLTSDATGSTVIEGGTIDTVANQSYGDDVVLGANTTLTSGGNVNFAATVKSDGTNRALTVNDSGTTTFGGAVGGDGSVAGDKLASLTTDAGGTTAINGGSIVTTGTQTYGDNVTLGADAELTGSTITTQGTLTGNTRTLGIEGNAVFGDGTADTVTGVATLAVSGTTAVNTSTITSTGAQTYTGAVTLDTDVTVSGAGVGFASTVKSDGTNRALIVNDSGTTTFGGAVGGDGSVAGDKLASLTTDAGGTTAINGGGVITTGAQTYGDNVTLGADAVLAATTVSTQGTLAGNSHALDVTGDAVFGDDSADAITGVSTLAVSGSTLINTDTITATGAQQFGGAVTLGTDTNLTGSSLEFSSTVDSDTTTARSLNLVSTGGAGQNFVAAVGGIHALNALRIESAGVVTQGGSAPIRAAQLAIKSAGGVTLTHAGNDVDVLAALLSGNASLTFLDSDGVEIGTVGSGALKITGISDGSDTSNVSITVGGPLTQAASSPIALHGNLSIDTSAYNAGDVTVNNTGAAGTVLGDSLIAGDFTLSSTGNVTQASGAHLQVGGDFDINGGGAFVEGTSPDNLIGGGSASVSGNEIKLFGVITLSMDAGTGDLLASAWNGTSTTNASIAAADLAAGVQVVSAAGGKSISAVNSGAAVTLSNANSIGGSLSITTQGSYSSGGTAVATGITQSGALDLDAASFTVQQSTANAASGITGAGALNLSNAGNAFDGMVSMTAVGMNATLAASTDLNLGTVNAQNVSVSTTHDITQAAMRSIQADTLLLRNAHDVTLGNANVVHTLAADAVTGTLRFNNGQALTVGTAGSVNGIDGTGSVTITSSGDLVLDQAIAVDGSANITLATGSNFTNNVGANALMLGTGHFQIWSTDPSLDALNGLSPDFKQYNATYGSSSVLGTGDGVLYTLAPELSVTLTGTVSRVYDANVDATLAQSNYVITGTVGTDSVVLGTSGTFDNKNVGTGKTITVNPVIVSASDGGVQVYGYQIDSGSTSASGAIGGITRATITAVTGITAADKVYDGGTSATLGTGSAGFTGIFSGDTLTAASATGAFANRNASASPITVNVTGLTLGGADAGNYTLSNTTASTSAHITPYAVDLTGTRTYNGTTSVGAGSLTLGTLVGSETLTLSGNATASSRHVGTRTLTVGGLTLGNGTGLASNYTLTGGTHTVDITQANLTVSTTNVVKTYDGSLSASGTAVAAGGTQLFGSDTLLGGTFAFINANAGTGNRTVNVSGAVVNDGNGGNDYNVSYVANTTSTINPANITVSSSNITRTYDGTLVATGSAIVTSGALYHNASNGNVQDTLSGGSFAFTDKNAGAGNKHVSVSGVTVTDGNGGGNYIVTYADNTTSTINRALLTFNGSIADKEYDGNTSASVSGYSLSGLIGSETVTASTGAANFVDKNAGNGKAVTVSGITLANGTNGGLASNYTIASSAAATGNITPRVLQVNAVVDDKVYDGTTNAVLRSYGFTGFVGNETVTGVYTGTASFVDRHVGDDKGITITGISLVNGTNGGLASNYAVTTAANSTASITPASLYVAGVVALDKVYDGTTVAYMNTQAATVTGRFGADDVQISQITGSFLDKNVGTDKAIGAGTVTLSGADAGDYVLVQPTGLTASITPRALVVSASGIDKVYDGTTAANVGLSDNRVAGDVLTVNASSAFIDKNAGSGKYVNVSGITIGGADAGNYTVNGSTGTFATITRAALDLNVAGIDRVYDGTTRADVSIAATPIAGDDLTVGYANAAFDNRNAGTDKVVHVSGIYLTGDDASNYTVTSAASTAADITPAALTISVLAHDKRYDGNSQADVTLSDNRISGDQISVSATRSQFVDAYVGDDKRVDVSGISLSGSDSGNYVLANTSAQSIASIKADQSSISGTWTLPPSLPTPVPPAMPTPPAPVLDLTLPAIGGGSSGGGSIGSSTTVTSNGSNSHTTTTGGATAGGATSIITAGPTVTGAGTQIGSEVAQGIGGATGSSNANSVAPRDGRGSNGGGTATGTSGNGRTGSEGSPGANTDGANNSGTTAGSGTNGSSVSNAGTASSAASGTLANTRESASSEPQASTDGDTPKARERADDASIVVSVVHAPYGDLPGVISVRVPQQVIAAGRGFSFPLPAALVQAAGDGEVTVTLADGAPLPSWLRYVPASRSCVATQPPAGALPLTVIISIGSQRWNMTLSEQSER